MDYLQINFDDGFAAMRVKVRGQRDGTRMYITLLQGRMVYEHSALCIIKNDCH